MLAVEDLYVAYGQSTVLHGINFSIKPGEIVAILGRNGMGKTTLMKSLMGIVSSKSGKISIANEDVTAQKSHQRVASGFGYVPQGRMIFSSMKVEENIKSGLTTTKTRKIPEYIYEMFPVLLEMKNRRGGNLSGGQQQQLAIARALASNPKVLLLDEPTEGIQPSIIREMATMLKNIRDKENISILVSEQVLSFALDVADRILVMENGNVVYEDQRSNLDESTITKFLSI